MDCWQYLYFFFFFFFRKVFIYLFLFRPIIFSFLTRDEGEIEVSERSGAQSRGHVT